MDFSWNSEYSVEEMKKLVSEAATEKETADIFAYIWNEAWNIGGDVDEYEEGTPEYEEIEAISYAWFDLMTAEEKKIKDILSSEGYEIPDTEAIDVLDIFMKRNGYVFSFGWWFPADECLREETEQEVWEKVAIEIRGKYMDLSEMTYDEYRHQFKSVEDFELAFGQLTEDEARGLISRSKSSQSIKGCMIQFWRHYHYNSSSNNVVTKEMANSFNEKWSLEEYQEIIKICLIDYYGWSEYRTDPKLLAKRMEDEDSYIRQQFTKHTAPMDVAVDIEYCCG